MSKNLEELKKIKKENFTDTDDFKIYGTKEDVSNILTYLIPLLEDFKKRLKVVETELGIYTEEEIKNIKVDGTDPD